MKTEKRSVAATVGVQRNVIRDWMEDEANDCIIDAAGVIAALIHARIGQMDRSTAERLTVATERLYAAGRSGERLGVADGVALLQALPDMIASGDELRLVCERVMRAVHGQLCHLLCGVVRGGEQITEPVFGCPADQLVIVYSQCGECSQRFKIAILFPTGTTFDRIKLLCCKLVNDLCSKTCGKKIEPLFTGMAIYPRSADSMFLYGEAEKVLAHNPPDCHGKTVLPVGPVLYRNAKVTP